MSQQKKGTLLVLSTAIISGFAIFINKFGVKGLDPYFYTFLKNIIAGSFLVSLFILTKNFKSFLSLEKKEKIQLALVGLVGGSIPFLLFFKGLSLTSALKAGFIHKTLFLYVSLLAFFFLREKITKAVGLGFISLILGSALFLGIKPIALNIGDLYIFLAVLFWAAEIIISKKILAKTSGVLVGSARMFIGSIFIFLFLAFTGRVELIGSIDLTILSWGFISGAILAAYNFTFYSGLKYIKTSEAAAILTLGMPITGILTMIFLDKALTPIQALGTLLILLGAILVNTVSRKLVLNLFRKADVRN